VRGADGRFHFAERALDAGAVLLDGDPGLGDLRVARRIEDVPGEADEAAADALRLDDLLGGVVDRPAAVEARLAAMTPEERAQLNARIDEMPAGGDVLVLIGAVFLVLLILELVGVIDIFKKA